eukprot:9477708-Alexandrium_andersonii.AAC.1
MCAPIERSNATPTYRTTPSAPATTSVRPASNNERVRVLTASWEGSYLRNGGGPTCMMGASPLRNGPLLTA